MIPFHVSSAGRRSIQVPLASTIHSSSTLKMAVARTFTSKRPPSLKVRTTKPLDKLGENQKREQERDRQRDHRSKKDGFKKPRRKEWKEKEKEKDYSSQEMGSKVIQQSRFFYDLRRWDGEYGESSLPKIPIVSLDASALLDPLTYCKTSAKVAHTHGVSQSISGTDAARRLLRGKKEFIEISRKLRSPGLLTGHGVPLELLQHCIDLADALMQFYGQNIVEISFHNYNNDKSKDAKIPQILRIRGQDGTNRCSNWPTHTPIDWDYHMSLYLAVMERLVKNLSLVLQNRSEVLKSKLDDTETGNRTSEDFTASPLLFPNSNHVPQWNVDILRGGVFQFYDRENGMPNDENAPHVIVEFSHNDKDTEAMVGHVLIRLQGKAMPNSAFHIDKTGKPVTLVFDACFR